ncbi:FecR domain-containing protein [Sphingobacterium sp.]|uniref:FecR family protein n=1 Tax=Sphingobacterium sp. TaxID=341027 RepID=UPI0031D0D4A9
MDSKHFRAAELVSRYVRNDISEAELQELKQLTVDFPLLSSWIEDHGVKIEDIDQRIKYYQSVDKTEIWKDIVAKSKVRRQSKTLWKYAAASAAILILFVSLYFYHSNPLKSDLTAEKGNKILPGTEKAILTLSDGKTIELSGMQSETISDGNTSLKVHDNQLDYSANSGKKVAIHKLSVPFGATYHIQLEDGTRVWLNADSELEFPSIFSGKDRIVSIKGEAYFEVAKDASHPFKVKVNGTEIEALGTAFNINTHLFDKKVKTILTEGKIRVSEGGQNKTIVAGHATISGQGKIEVNKADLEEALSWKEGYFYFDSKNLKDILGEISRWYAIDIDIQRTLTNDHFKGGIKRSSSITTVCKTLADLTGFQFIIEGNKLIIK